MDYAADIDFALSRTVDVLAADDARLVVPEGTPVSGRLRITDEAEDEVRDFVNAFIDRGAAPTVLTLEAELQIGDDAWQLRDFLEYFAVHFRPGTVVTEARPAEFAGPVALSRVVDSRNNVPLVVDGTEITVREKYMGAEARFDPATSPVVVECTFFDGQNLEGNRTIYYERPLEDVIFPRFGMQTWRDAAGALEDACPDPATPIGLRRRTSA